MHKLAPNFNAQIAAQTAQSSAHTHLSYRECVHVQIEQIAQEART